jgi:hypothetical protein
MTSMATALLVATAVLGSLARTAPPAHADDGTVKADTGDGALLATAGVESFRSGSGGGSGPRCTWEKHEGGFGVDAQRNGSFFYPGTRKGPNGEDEVLYLKVCPNPNGSSQFIYVPPVNVAAVRAAALDSVKRLLPLPVLNVSPSQGGLIRMQNWLAVQPVADVTATASVGPVWITMTATQNSLLWDMGNGDTVTCDGTGSPLPDGVDNMLDDDVNGAAECGYTYQHVSAPKFGANDDSAYENSVTTAWAITWVDYTGATGTLADLERSTAWNFQVRQIQTQRVSPDD